MGVASYNRGSNAIKAQIDNELRPVEFEVMDNLNALQKYPDAGKPFGPINFSSDVIRGGFWAECPKSGYGFYYPTLKEAVRRWRVQIIALNHGVWTGMPTA